MSELYSQLRDFTVSVDDGSGGDNRLWSASDSLGKILQKFAHLLSQTAHQGRGIGTELIKALMAEARDMGVKKVFVLTYRPNLFERQGFKVMDKSQLPHKIWADCIRCTKFPECDEIAMIGNP